MSLSDILFALIAMVAAGCFAALVTLQVMEVQYYEESTQGIGGNVWPASTGRR